MLPSYIGDMTLLRFLDLSRNPNIKVLPDSICKLQSLESLELAGCTALEGLPRDIKKLNSLLLLSVTTKESSFTEKTSIGRLTSLKTLVIPNCENLASLPSNLRCLSALETLYIIGCEKLVLSDDDEEREIKSLSLRMLVFMKLPEMSALPKWLQGSANTLQCLRIEDCLKLTRLPLWLPSVKPLHKVEIHNCPNLLSLPGTMDSRLLAISGCPQLTKSKDDDGVVIMKESTDDQ